MPLILIIKRFVVIRDAFTFDIDEHNNSIQFIYPVL